MDVHEQRPGAWPLGIPVTPPRVTQRRPFVVAEDLETKLGTPGALTPEIPAMEWFDTAPHPAQLRVRETLGAHPTLESLMDLGFRVSLAHRRQEMSKMGLDTLLGLHELIVYGLKGVAAYGHHAEVLGYTSETVDGFMWEALGFLTREESRDVNAVLTMALRLGEVNLETMRLLDQANTETYGTPTPTPVRITPKKGKALLVSGHDLRDLEQILQQTEGTGINGERALDLAESPPLISPRRSGCAHPPPSCPRSWHAGAASPRAERACPSPSLQSTHTGRCCPATAIRS